MKKLSLQAGELYAGIVLGKDGCSNYHLILLPQKSKPLSWDGAIEWAATVGGGLPTLREQSILFGNLKEEFESQWYWSSEQHASYSGFAWIQHFDEGSQLCHERYELRARAIRRVEIQ